MKYYLLTFLLCIIGSTTAQYSDPGLPGGDPDVPLDGGVTLLLIAGVCYGIKRIKESKQ
ncbi:hypothetical protein ACVWYN_002353 [Pedobacter sp. UYP24]